AARQLPSAARPRRGSGGGGRSGGRGLARLLPLLAAAAAAEPNPPEWPESVRVWGPGDDAGQIESVVNEAFRLNGGHDTIDHGQFSPERYAFMFKPGTYHVDVPVGYYTQVLGLGKSPDDVVFDSARGVYSEEGDQTDLGGALSTFWRSAENFRTRSEMLWAVSQAAPMRRVVVEKSLNLAQFVDGVGMGYSSGGFLGNCRVKGMVNSASQQQWFARNLQAEAWPQGNWNMVFVGVNPAPSSSCGRTGDSFPSTSVETTPVLAEKPFVSIDDDGKFSLQIPQLQHDRQGYDFSIGDTVPFEKVYVARATDSAAKINKKLKKGLHCVLTPGIYKLDAPLELNTEGQVLLGLGLATLVATDGTPAIRVGNVDGVRVAGVLLEAGTGETEALLEWGDGTHKGDATNPGVMSDLFARVGGPNDPEDFEVQARVMVRIRSDHVIGDNLWLWRADHGVAGIVKSSMNPCDHGLIVEGDHVTMYGLAVEHTLKDLVQWIGDHGRTYFFQSELPYDVGQDFGDAGYVGYRLNNTVSTHSAYGVGVYHFFRDFEVTVPRGIACPDWLENSFENPLSVCLSGKGTMTHVINDKGNPTQGDASTEWYCEKGPEIAPRPVAKKAQKEEPEHSAKQTHKEGSKKAPATPPKESPSVASENPAAPHLWARWDCSVGQQHWRRAWSANKQEWCCKHEQRGCDGRQDDEGGAIHDSLAALSGVAASLAAEDLADEKPTGLRGGGSARPARSGDAGSRAGSGHASKPAGSASTSERPRAVVGAQADRPWTSPWSTHTLEDGLLIERLDEVQATPVAATTVAPAPRWIQSLVALQLCASAVLAVLCFLGRRQRRGGAMVPISTSSVDADATAAVTRQAGEPLQPRSPALRGITSPGTASPLTGASDAAA
ncbi:unnamed protein product, partial [Prorocentrum cordatum]